MKHSAKGGNAVFRRVQLRFKHKNANGFEVFDTYGANSSTARGRSGVGGVRARPGRLAEPPPLLPGQVQRRPDGYPREDGRDPEHRSLPEAQREHGGLLGRVVLPTPAAHGTRLGLFGLFRVSF